MNILLLGGNSPQHKLWLHQLGAFLESAGHVVIRHEYHHWQTGEPNADIEAELRRLRPVASQLANYAVIAKSVGTVIATLGIARGLLQPTQCVFLGVPLAGIAGETPDFLPSLAALPPTTIMQNDHDPYGSFDLLQQTLPPLPQLTLQTSPGATHDYVDFAAIAAMLH